jgi:hypothetical protein
MSAWNYPVVIIAALGAALFFYRLIVSAGQQRATPAFECLVCGRRQLGADAKTWRYCPYCGAPRDAKALSALMRRAGS